MGDVLRDAVDEVCKRTQDGELVNYLCMSLQKVYARTLGERSYGVFEAVHLGLQLPLIIPIMPVVSLNTLGARSLKSAGQLREAPADAPEAWGSKIDKFDKRLAIVRKQFARDADARVQWEADIRHVSLCEFWWKYYVDRSRILLSSTTSAIMVTPAMSADCANVEHGRRDACARMCVLLLFGG
jgi:hypothetical protein